jgi:hypothetical protein
MLAPHARAAAQAVNPTVLNSDSMVTGTTLEFGEGPAACQMAPLLTHPPTYPSAITATSGAAAVAAQYCTARHHKAYPLPPPACLPACSGRLGTARGGPSTRSGLHRRGRPRSNPRLHKGTWVALLAACHPHIAMYCW